jgi:hypothetical protein
MPNKQTGKIAWKPSTSRNPQGRVMRDGGRSRNTRISTSTTSNMTIGNYSRIVQNQYPGERVNISQRDFNKAIQYAQQYSNNAEFVQFAQIAWSQPSAGAFMNYASTSAMVDDWGFGFFCRCYFEISWGCACVATVIIVLAANGLIL